jgi:hypothetical protein
MKIQLVLLFLLFSNAFVYADGRTYVPIQLLFETKSGEKTIAWIDYIIKNDMNEIDSEKHEDYLKKYFYGKNCIDSLGNIDYYKYRVHYSYEFIDSNKQQIKYESYTKLEWGNLLYSEIRNITVLHVDDVRKKWNDTNIVCVMYIENQIVACDTLWMKRKPIQKFSFKGDACSFELIVHERNSKIDSLVKELKKLEMKLVNDQEKDEKMLIRMQKIKGLKVIVLVPPCLC